MTYQPRARYASSMPWFALLAGLMLTGCPLSDHYYVETSVGGTRSFGADSGTGTSGSFTAGGGPEGGAGAMTGGESTDIGGLPSTAGAAGTASVSCSPENCSATCCGEQCVDLGSSANHCGDCSRACPTGRACRAGTCFGWTSMSAPPQDLVAREKAAYAVMNGKLLVFGGLDGDGNALGSGAIYDPETDGWTMLPMGTNAPSPRQLATAVWSGLRMFVVGGQDAGTTLAYSDGARFS